MCVCVLLLLLLLLPVKHSHVIHTVNLFHVASWEVKFVLDTAKMNIPPSTILSNADIQGRNGFCSEGLSLPRLSPPLLSSPLLCSPLLSLTCCCSSYYNESVWYQLKCLGYWLVTFVVAYYSLRLNFFVGMSLMGMSL